MLMTTVTFKEGWWYLFESDLRFCNRVPETRQRFVSGGCEVNGREPTSTESLRAAPSMVEGGWGGRRECKCEREGRGHITPSSGPRSSDTASIYS